MTMPSAMTALAIAQQHVEPTTGQVIAQQAVFKINQKSFTAGIYDTSPLNSVKFKARRDNRH
jgi:glutaminase